MAGIFTSAEIELDRLAESRARKRIGNLLRYLPGDLRSTRRSLLVLFKPMFR